MRTRLPLKTDLSKIKLPKTEGTIWQAGMAMDHDGLCKYKGEEYITYWLIRRISTVLKSNSSKNGRAENPSFAGCIPASSCKEGIGQQ